MKEWSYSNRYIGPTRDALLPQSVQVFKKDKKLKLDWACKTILQSGVECLIKLSEDPGPDLFPVFSINWKTTYKESEVDFMVLSSFKLKIIFVL